MFIPSHCPWAEPWARVLSSSPASSPLCSSPLDQRQDWIRDQFIPFGAAARGPLSISWCAQGQVLQLRPPIPRWTLPLCLTGQARESYSPKRPSCSWFSRRMCSQGDIPSEGLSTTLSVVIQERAPLCVFPQVSLIPQGSSEPQALERQDGWAAWEKPLHPGDQLAAHTRRCALGCPLSLPGRQEGKSCHLTDCPSLQSQKPLSKIRHPKPSLPGSAAQSATPGCHLGSIKKKQAGPGPKSVPHPHPHPYNLFFIQPGLGYHEKLISESLKI